MYQLFVFKGDKPEAIGSGVPLDEAERLALVLCRVAAKHFGQIPKRAGNLWYILDTGGLKPLYEIVCWLQMEDAKQQLKYFVRTQTPHAAGGLLVRYILRRDANVNFYAYCKGVSGYGNGVIVVGHMWSTMASQTAFRRAHNLKREEALELAGLWADYEQERQALPKAERGDCK